MGNCVKVLVAQSCLTLCNPMNCIAHQAPLSMGFCRQEYRSGLPFLAPGDLLDLGVKAGFPPLQADFLQSEQGIYELLIRGKAIKEHFIVYS